jgi:hypothetical protein
MRTSKTLTPPLDITRPFMDDTGRPRSGSRGPHLLLVARRISCDPRGYTPFARKGGSAPATECDFPCLAMPTQPWLQRSRARRELRARYRVEARAEPHPPAPRSPPRAALSLARERFAEKRASGSRPCPVAHRSRYRPKGGVPIEACDGPPIAATSHSPGTNADCRSHAQAERSSAPSRARLASALSRMGLCALLLPDEEHDRRRLSGLGLRGERVADRQFAALNAVGRARGDEHGDDVGRCQPCFGCVADTAGD